MLNTLIFLSLVSLMLGQQSVTAVLSPAPLDPSTVLNRAYAEMNVGTVDCNGEIFNLFKLLEISYMCTPASISKLTQLQMSTHPLKVSAQGSPADKESPIPPELPSQKLLKEAPGSKKTSEKDKTNNFSNSAKLSPKPDTLTSTAPFSEPIAGKTSGTTLSAADILSVDLVLPGDTAENMTAAARGPSSNDLPTSNSTLKNSAVPLNISEPAATTLLQTSANAFTNSLVLQSEQLATNETNSSVSFTSSVSDLNAEMNTTAYNGTELLLDSLSTQKLNTTENTTLVEGGQSESTLPTTTGYLQTAAKTESNQPVIRTTRKQDTTTVLPSDIATQSVTTQTTRNLETAVTTTTTARPFTTTTRLVTTTTRPFMTTTRSFTTTTRSLTTTTAPRFMPRNRCYVLLKNGRGCKQFGKQRCPRGTRFDITHCVCNHAYKVDPVTCTYIYSRWW